MKLTLSSPQIWLSSQPVDFRRSIDGLCEIVKSHFSANLKEGVFIFLNRSRKKVKILTWHKNGFVLIYKRLEQGCFKLCKAENDIMTLDEKQLSWLLAGLDWVSMSNWNELEFHEYF
ncbi:MAG TPA: IS66 family insertion sequence element accessory protein TnpB [Gammaproteobacteria bacterium]|nr:IS66 family insertion sequence element accessory protein TnpB [Gammaproteobacteria bacterium]HWA25718.1 IS66 family insertion sequence element accessory protein TnpB [Lacunisphaera sp.]